MPELSSSASKQGELWGKAVRDWVELQEPAGRPLWEAALSAVHAGPGTRLLDAGCGAGGASLLASARGAGVAGIDPSVPMLTVARERLPLADFRIAELESLPFSNATFDAAIAVNSVQFAADPRLAVHELGRVTRTGGRVAIVVFDAPEYSDIRAVFEAVLALFDRPPSGRGPFALSYPGALESLFDSVPSLRLERIDPIDCAYQYPDLDSAVRAQLSTGPTQRAMEIHGAERVTNAVRRALEPFVRPDGAVTLASRFRLASALTAAG